MTPEAALHHPGCFIDHKELRSPQEAGDQPHLCMTALADLLLFGKGDQPQQWGAGWPLKLAGCQFPTDCLDHMQPSGFA